LKNHLVKNNISYLKFFFGFVLSALLLLGVFNWYVDPFEIYWTGEYEPRRKVFMKKLWIFKAMNIRKIAPQAVMLGSSRSMIGLDAEHPGGDSSVYPRYNLGLPASNLYEILSYLQHANELTPVKQAIIGVDFFSFNVFYQAKTEFNDSFLLSEGDSKLFSRFRETMVALFTLTSFDLSKRKIRSKGKETSYLNGSSTDFYKYTQRYPPGKSFLHNQKNYLSIFLHPPPRHQFCLYDQNGKNSQMQALRKLVDLAHRKKIDLRIFIHPIHASLQEIIKYAGLWPAFEDWKQKLVRITSEQNMDQAQKVQLWDFSGYNRFTTEEKTPLEALAPTMKWYWEALHYRKELGDRVLDRIYNHRHERRIIPDDFGILLSKNNIDGHLKLIREQQTEYERLHIEEKEIWIQRIEKVKKKRKSSDCHSRLGA
jgi:hypothetical protein|tara:strand:+ start:1002 stop:2276 length:1275 start_codon:yes stop_codon:yes gene_type:complete